MLYVNHAAGTRTALIVVILHASENRDLCPTINRKCLPVVLQKDRALLCDRDRRLRIFIPVE